MKRVEYQGKIECIIPRVNVNTRKFGFAVVLPPNKYVDSASAADGLEVGFQESGKSRLIDTNICNPCVVAVSLQVKRDEWRLWQFALQLLLQKPD